MLPTVTRTNSSAPSSPLQKTWSWRWSFTWPSALPVCYARSWTTRPRCCMTQRLSEKGCSGLVKVLCTAQDCSAGKKGSRKGKPLKQGGALAKFNDWFGSMSLMNTLYVWFSASWGPSVVEAISKRNQRSLQQNPIHRDPAMFNSLEV